MRIAFLTPTLELAGGTIVLRRYVSALVAAGHSVVIISPNRGEWKESTLNTTILTYPTVPIRYLDTLTFQYPYFHHIRRLLSTQKDIDCIVPIYTPLLPVATWFQKRINSSCRIYLLAQEGMEIPIIGQYNRHCLKKYVNSITKIVSVSSNLTEQIRAILPSTTTEIVTIPNGIDHKIFLPNAEVTRTTGQILFVGRPDPTKGYPEFVKIIEYLHERNPQIFGVIVAPKQFTISHPLLKHVTLPQHELARVYQESEVYICTSHAESFGLPALEAMACGTPVITTITTGSSAYAINGENCISFPIGDWKVAAQAYLDLFQNSNKKNLLIRNGLSTASQYNWHQSEKQFVSTLTDSD